MPILAADVARSLSHHLLPIAVRNIRTFVHLTHSNNCICDDGDSPYESARRTGLPSTGGHSMDDLLALDGGASATQWQKRHAKRKAAEARKKITAIVRAEKKADLKRRLKKWRAK